MKKLSMLGLLALAIMGYANMQAIPTLTIKNDSKEAIVVQATHSFCRLRGIGSAYTDEAYKKLLAQAQTINKDEEKKKETEKKEEDKDKAAEKKSSAVKDAAKKAALEAAKQAWNVFVSKEGKPCWEGVIRPGGKYTVSVRTGLSGIIKGFSLFIKNDLGEELVTKTPDVKRDTEAVWNGSTLTYVDKKTGDTIEKEGSFPMKASASDEDMGLKTLFGNE